MSTGILTLGNQIDVYLSFPELYQKAKHCCSRPDAMKCMGDGNRISFRPPGTMLSRSGPRADALKWPVWSAGAGGRGAPTACGAALISRAANGAAGYTFRVGSDRPARDQQSGHEEKSIKPTVFQKTRFFWVAALGTRASPA